MHFSQPVQESRSTTSPVRVMWMDSGGHRGLQRPHSSQTSLSTMAIRAGFRVRGTGEE